LRRNTIIRIALIVLFIIIGIILFVTGKEHKVFIDNKNISIGDNTYLANSPFRVWVDKKDIGIIEKGKRVLVKVVGVKHKIVAEEVRENTSTGEEFEEEFTLKINESAIISLPILAKKENGWIAIKTNE